jgi:serine/threonine protein kinase
MYNELTGKVFRSCLYKLSDSKAFVRKAIRAFGSLNEEDISNELRAIDKLCRNRHPNIVQILGHGLLRPGMAFPIHYIDMELCHCTLQAYANGENFPSLRNWRSICTSGLKPEYIAAFIFEILEDIINGLIFIHGHDEVHRDLSPSNGKLLVPISSD